MTFSGRRLAATTAAVLAGVALLGALVTGYASRALFDADRFADRAAAALDEPAVAEEIARRATDDLEAAQPNLVAVRPLIEGAIEGVVSGGAFQGLFRAAVRDVHRALLEQDLNTVTLTVADVGATARGALAALQPKLANKVPADEAAELLDVEPPAVVTDIAQVAERVRPLPWILLAAAVVLAGLALGLAPDRRRAVIVLGVTIMIGAVVVIVALRAARAILLGDVGDPQMRDAAGAIWDVYLSDLRTALLLFAACGAVVAAAGSSLLRPVDIGEPLRRSWDMVATVPETTALRVLRAALLVLVGVVIVIRHETFVDLVAILIGLYIAYAGVSELMRLAMPDTAEEAVVARRGRSALAVSGIAAVAILAAGVVFITVGGVDETPAAIETQGCNGSEALCDKPLGDVAFPTTHNAMSAASNPGWLFAQQERGLPDQLRDGVRALMIDAHYGRETGDGTVKTDLSDLSGPERKAYEEEIGPEALDAALRIRDRLVGGEAGQPGVYLCHRFCELGALPIDRALGEIRDFLAANPDEVLVIVIEDYVAPGDIAAAVEESGLIDYVYEGPPGPPWPTLGEMIESGGRAVVMAEQDAGDIPWYHQAYDFVQETPYSFKNPAELTDPDKLAASCKPNRGPDDASIFLINHWVDTSPAPQPSNAAKVNAAGPLAARVEECERRRGLDANLVAVDFYREGDLFEVVRKLNSDEDPTVAGG